MPRKNPTSVVLNETVQKIKDELSPIYGLKNILSAGLMLFSRLSADDQKKVIAEINYPPQEDTAEQTQGQVSRAMHMIKELSPDGSLHIEMLSDEDLDALGELVKLIDETKAFSAEKIVDAAEADAVKKKRSRGRSTG